MIKVSMRPYGQGILSDSTIYFSSLSCPGGPFLYPLCTGHYYCDNTYIVDRTNYDSFLILYLQDGTSWYMDGLKKVLMKPGDFAIIDCYQPHCYGSDEGCELFWVHFDGQNARRYYQYIQNLGPRPCPLNPEEALRCLRQLYRTFEGGETPSLPRLSQQLLGVLTEFMMSSPKQASSLAGRLDAVRTYIDQNLTQPLPLEELAERAGLSVYYFARKFKDRFGLTPHDYIIHARLSLAAFYIKTTDLPLQAVASRSGFTDASSFSVSFRKHMGLTPAQYRLSSSMKK
jgi:AraC-like DNA-binding protein